MEEKITLKNLVQVINHTFVFNGISNITENSYIYIYILVFCWYKNHLLNALLANQPMIAQKLQMNVKLNSTMGKIMAIWNLFTKDVIVITHLANAVSFAATTKILVQFEQLSQLCLDN